PQAAPVKDKSDELLMSPQSEMPKLPPAMPYVPKDNIVDMDLSEWPGYAGIIAANNGFEPTDNSIFFKKFGFKLRIRKSEEDNWAGLNAGQFAVAATTADVLPVYGKQFKVITPLQIDFSRGADGVVVRSNIKRINDLKGKILASAQFNESDFFIRFLGQEANLPVHVLASATEQPDANAINLLTCKDAFSAGDLFVNDLQQPAGKLAGCVTWAPKTTEVAEKSGGKAVVLTTNRNLLIVADILIVNKGFADQNPKMVAGLVEGILEGNRLVSENPDQYLDLLGKVYKWDKAQAKAELAKVHLSNLPENLAFFSGAIDMAGSFDGIFQSAILAYGNNLIKDPADSKKFADTSFLEALKTNPTFAAQKIEIAPIRTSNASSSVEGDPLLTKDIRFLFEPNSSTLDQKNADNMTNLEGIKKLIQVSPGSTILLRGHVDNAQVEYFRKQGGEALVNQQALKAMELSRNRADEVKRLIIEKYKVDGKRIETVGRGWNEPASSSNPEMNRRVEVQWFTLEN
ncbi:TPA: hypothetical protein DDW35_05575, partial [Candidatus Sumerlaeota bacterium]|nr:hypothetical protein [Candidatus Sumerlaeota bacterium]